MRLNKIVYRSGFSLVEILVVIGIIGILVTLAMSGLTTAKAKSKSTRCVANLRQLAAACHLYASDFADSMPPNSTTRHSGATEDIPSWTAGMLDYSDSNTDNTNTVSFGQVVRSARRTQDAPRAELLDERLRGRQPGHLCGGSGKAL